MKYLLLILLTDCASTEEAKYPDCAAVTLRSGETCEIPVFADPQWPRL